MLKNKNFFLISITLFSLLFISCQKHDEIIFSGKNIQIRKSKTNSELVMNGKPFFIKGACGVNNIKELKAAGGNSLRTYDTLNLKNILDEAYENQIYVTAGIPIIRQLTGFSYHNQNQVDSLKNAVKKTVLTYKDHPALLMWGLGNELFLPNPLKNYRFYQVINDLIDIIHETDPDHPVTTMILNANLKKRIIKIWMGQLNFDLLSFNTFGRLSQLEQDLSWVSAFYNRPYIVSEWGVNGPWEETKTIWHAPVESSPLFKSIQIQERYQKYIKNQPGCIGSYVFYWGQKQETTHTWFSIFGELNFPTEMYQGLANVWNGMELKLSYPKVKFMMINGKGSADNILLKKRSVNNAVVVFEHQGPNQKNGIAYQWELLPEGVILDKWEEKQEKPNQVEDFFIKEDRNILFFKAPSKEGPYRLFVHVYSPDNTYATTNVPFYVIN